mmetsp:Transcript_2589/g.7593  ORF Transcript_2589/g.7593 Transcript_2589/m.7593 type:complete len:210 (+) Transcript_2589:98-727(+)|eukprot:CAMPEP_0119270766 /NCGR_PEP_ID=MMETSP1329-20130426/7636_1 /TAXON_ID=114041 /ORGANISM="Genus nov. species nov., Strain RCC1024" /LENGTH=209 /DNA_ID=CAMNT_0007270797 /DNA_START=99 /DNA_END=728 /DNA_ORIENTATION=-
MKLLLALVVGAGALAPSMGPRVARHTAMCSTVAGPTEAGTAVLEDTEGLGAAFEEALVDDEAWDVDDSADEDVLADFDLDAADVGEIKDDYSVPGRILCAAERAEAVKTYARHEGDVGSSEVQIALFTARIKYITEHVINNPKDHATRRGLLALVSKRRRLLNYYYKVAPAKAEQLTRDLGIRFRFKSALPSRTEKYRQYTIAANRRNK